MEGGKEKGGGGRRDGWFLHPKQLESECGKMQIFYFMCTGILPACMSAYHMHDSQRPERASDLKLEMAVSHCVGDGTKLKFSANTTNALTRATTLALQNIKFLYRDCHM